VIVLVIVGGVLVVVVVAGLVTDRKDRGGTGKSYRASTMTRNALRHRETRRPGSGFWKR
jgi:hypothetical protein